MIKIVGFCDVADKGRGSADITLFRAEHWFVAGGPPTPETLQAYATERGYYPSGKRGAAMGRCDPVYLYAKEEDA